MRCHRPRCRRRTMPGIATRMDRIALRTCAAERPSRTRSSSHHEDRAAARSYPSLAVPTSTLVEEPRTVRAGVSRATLHLPERATGRRRIAVKTERQERARPTRCACAQCSVRFDEPRRYKVSNARGDCQRFLLIAMGLETSRESCSPSPPPDPRTSPDHRKPRPCPARARAARATTGRQCPR